MKLTRNEDGSFTLERENGSVTLTGNEMSFLFNQYAKVSLRDTVKYRLQDLDGDLIDLERYPYSFDELIDEVFSLLEDEIDYGNMPNEDDITDRILDTAAYYDGMLIG